MDLHTYDPVATARGLGQPLLILQGGRDYQVTQADLDGWKKELVSRANVTYRLYPGLNHLFIAGEGVPSPAEYGRPGRVDQAVIDDLARWVNGLPPRR